MDKKSKNLERKNESKSSANQPFNEFPNVRSNWPPPLQLEKEEEGENIESTKLVQDMPPPFNPDANAILNSNITIQQKPLDSFNQLGAKAYTQGQNIFLPETFSSDESTDQKTLLHEVSHAMTNQSSSPIQTKSKNGFSINDDPVLENNADKQAEQLHQSLDQNHINQIIQKKSVSGLNASGPIQRKETEDEKLINASRTSINKINKDQAIYNEAMNQSLFNPGFLEDDYDPSRSYDVRRNLEYSKLIPILKKDIIHLVRLNTKESERIAKISMHKHLSGSQEQLSETGYKASQEISKASSGFSEKSTNYAGGRLGNLGLKTTEERRKDDKIIKINQGVLNEVKAQDALIFIASNLDRSDLLKNLQSGKTGAEKRAAINEIMTLFNYYTSKTIQFVEESPFEFGPVIQELKKGRIGASGFDWSSDPQLVQGIVGQANWEKMLVNLVPDVLSLILAIAAGFASGGMSVALTGLSLAAESQSVSNTYNEMKGSEAASKSNASDSLEVLDKTIANAKEVEFFFSLGGMFLGGTIDGIEIAGKVKATLKPHLRRLADKYENVSITKISNEEYAARIGGSDGEKAYIERRKEINSKKETAKKEKKSDEEINAIKMSPEDEKLTLDLIKILKKNDKAFAEKMPTAIRNAGGWKTLLKDVGEDPFIRAGMERYRSNLFKRLADSVSEKYNIPLIRTGSQADAEAGILELMMGAKSDLDTTIRGNKVHQIREMIRKELCDEFACAPNKLGDYLDMSIFANTPVKAVIDTISDPIARTNLLEDQSRFEMATIYNLLYKNAVKKGHTDKAAIFKKQMDQLKIPKEQMHLYEKMAEQDQLQLVIDKAMQESEKLQEQIAKNKAKMPSLSQEAREALEQQNKFLEKQIHSKYKEAMIGTTLMDISDSESFWSHTGVMEIVFKQNPDFKELISKGYTESQKQIMVVHDMAQLESKLMKLEKLSADFKEIQNIDTGLLKDINKSSSRLANTLSINAIDEETKKSFDIISKRLIQNKKDLSGPVSKDTIQQFKDELQNDLIKIDALCKEQIAEMADSSMVSKFGDTKMIQKYQSQMRNKMILEDVSQRIQNFMNKLGGNLAKRSGAGSRIVNAALNENKSNILESPEVKEKVSNAKESIRAGNSTDTIQSLLYIGEALKSSGQEIEDMKFDHMMKNYTSSFKYLKKRSSEQGGLFNKDDIARVEFIKAGFNKLSNYVYKSALPQNEKDQLQSIIGQLNINLDHLIEPVIKGSNDVKNTATPKEKVVIETNFDTSDGHFSVEDRKKRDALLEAETIEKEKPIIKTNDTDQVLVFRIGVGKYEKVLVGEKYYWDKRKNVYKGKVKGK